MSHKLLCHLLCESFQPQLFESLEERYKFTHLKDATFFELGPEEYIVLFQYGAVIGWNTSYDSLMFFLKTIQEFEQHPLETPIVEEFAYVEASEFNIHFDVLSIPNHDATTLCAISHALAQNVKLIELERKVHSSIEENQIVPLELAQKGSISLSKKQLSMKIGELFLVKSQINLQYDLLDTPDFFWNYPEYENIYLRITKYLDVNARIAVLNKRVEVLQELLDMLSHEQNHRYSSILEWIIIGLILFEIVLTLKDHF